MIYVPDKILDKSVSKNKRESVSVDVLAEFLVLSSRRVQQLAGEGVIVKDARGKYDLVGSVRAYVKYLNDLIPNKQLDGSAKTARLDTESHRAVLMRENSILARLKREEKEGVLVNKDRERRDAFKLARSLRNTVLNIPARVSVRFAADRDADKIFRSLEKELIEALEMTAEIASGNIDDGKFVFLGGEDCQHWCGR